MTCILLYHRVADDGWRHSITPQHFGEQLDVLRSETDVIPLAEVRRGGVTQTSRPRVAITFDDGYADNLTCAWPLLDARTLPATFFIVSGSVGDTREFWWDELEWICTHALDAAVKASYWDLHERLRRHSAGKEREVLDAMAISFGVRPIARAEKLPMTQAQLERLAREPLAEIAAHTVAHPLLPALSPAAQAVEIQHSKRDLADMTGRPIVSFSYPYGGHSPETMRLVEEAGFHRACKVGTAPVGQESRFALPRLSPKDWDGEQFARHLHDYCA